MSENKALPPRRKIFDLDEMSVERDGIQIKGVVYDFVGPADIGADDLAQIFHLEKRVQEQQEVIDAADNLGTVGELMKVARALKADSGVGPEAEVSLTRIEEDLNRRVQAAPPVMLKQLDQMAEMFALVKQRTRLVLDADVPEEVIEGLSIVQHAFIYMSFWSASSDVGQLEALRAAARAADATSAT